MIVLLKDPVPWICILNSYAFDILFFSFMLELTQDSSQIDTFNFWLGVKMN
jgi:hypothetical protein